VIRPARTREAEYTVGIPEATEALELMAHLFNERLGR